LGVKQINFNSEIKVNFMVKIEEKAINLPEAIKSAVEGFLSLPETQGVTNLHDMVLEQIEPALFKSVIEHCKYNQSKAAILLGLSRGTCRMKLKKYFDDQYCGNRAED
jgi:Fis family transcriptional regulator